MTTTSNTSHDPRVPLLDANGATDAEGNTKLMLVEPVRLELVIEFIGFNELKVGPSNGVVTEGTVIDGVVNISEDDVATPGLWHFGLLALSR